MPNAALTLIVTRPEPQAGDWVRRLLALGQPALALPLLGIAALEDGASRAARAWQGLVSQRLVMFVSPNAVAQFFAACPAGRVWPAATLAGATGPGTVAALRQAGVPAASILAPRPDSPSFDAEALWRDRLADLDWAGQSVLIVRGEGGRDWLAATLGAAGARVELLPIYRQTAPGWLQTPSASQVTEAPPALLTVALTEPRRHVWLFSSSQAVRQLAAFLEGWMAPHPAAQTLAPGRPGGMASLRAIATHPRIAQSAREARWGEVLEASAPLESVLAGLAAMAA